jgi:hypothetical protein
MPVRRNVGQRSDYSLCLTVGGTGYISHQEIIRWYDEISILHGFWTLKAVTQTLVYSIPDVWNNLLLVAGSRYLTIIDIENTYWNIPIKMEDRDKTGFVTPFGSFQCASNWQF